MLVINESTSDATQSLSLENLDSLDSKTTISVPTLVNFTVSSLDNDEDQVVDQSWTLTNSLEEINGFTKEEHSLFNYNVANRMKKIYVKVKIRLGRNSLKKRIGAAKFIKDMFSENLRSDRSCEWFANELGFDNESSFVIKTILVTIQAISELFKFSKTICKSVYEFWKSNSTIKIDRRNKRTQIETILYFATKS